MLKKCVHFICVMYVRFLNLRTMSAGGGQAGTASSVDNFGSTETVRIVFARSAPTMKLWVGRLRGERKLLEESPDTEGQGRWVTPTRGNPRESATEIHGRWRGTT